MISTRSELARALQFSHLAPATTGHVQTSDELHLRIILELTVPASEYTHDLFLDSLFRVGVTRHELDTVYQPLVRECGCWREYGANRSLSVDNGL